jgi:hypothetical protein
LSGSRRRREMLFSGMDLDLEALFSLRGELDQSGCPFCFPSSKLSRRGVLLLTKMGELVLQETLKFDPILNEEI